MTAYRLHRTVSSAKIATNTKLVLHCPQWFYHQRQFLVCHWHRRRRRLASQYSLKICSNLSNPARNCAFDERFTKLFDKRPNQIRPLGLRIKTDLSAIGFKQKDIFNSSIGLLNDVIQIQPRPIPVAIATKFKTRSVITRLAAITFV